MNPKTMENTEQNFKVLLLPWLAHGHISPFLELAKNLLVRNFHVYFCSTTINLDYIKKRFESNDLSLEFVELHLPNSQDLPPHHHTTKGLPSHLMGKLIDAYESASPSFSKIIKGLNLDLIIYDGFQSWAPTMASSYGIPSVFFVTSGAASMSFFCYMLGCRAKDKEVYIYPEIFLRDYEMKRLLSLSTSQVQKSDNSPVKNIELSSEFVLIKSSNQIESKYIDYFSSLCGKRVIPLGPLVQGSTYSEEENYADIINWLNKKDHSSVVYVSFGSEYFLTKDEREEIAYGLELSKVDFIWVLRFPVGKSISIENAVPRGFLDSVKERGLMVDEWAPQARILEHPNTAAFMSHCGWSSVMESLYNQVPLIAMPMTYDQPTNARLVVDTGAGVEVLRDENGELRREEIAKVIRKLVVEKDGEEVKRKCKEVGRKMKREETKEMKEAIDELRNLCIKNVLSAKKPLV